MAQVAEMCDYIKDGLGAAACESVVETDAKGFRLTGTMANPLRYDGLGFDDNIAGGATPLGLEEWRANTRATRGLTEGLPQESKPQCPEEPVGQR